MKKIILIGCFLVLCFFMSKAKAQQLSSQENSFYTAEIKDADAVVRLDVLNLFEDGCTECVSEGKLYIVKATVKKIYFNYRQKVDPIKDTLLFLVTLIDSSYLVQKPDSLIVFLNFHNPKGKRYYVPSKIPNVYWYAEQFAAKTEKHFSAIEKLINQQKNKRYAITKL